jgi:hypothetical protein
MSCNSFDWEIGTKVRVIKNTDFSSIGLISFYNEEDNTYDVVLENGKEENRINIARISNLEAFEIERDELTSTPFKCKEDGNKLYKLNDFGAAAQLYSEGLRLLLKKRMSIGTAVIIFIDNEIEMRHGIVAGIDEQSKQVDIIYDNLEENYDEKEEEEDGISMKRVIALADNEELEIQRALYLNLARCSVKLRSVGWSVRWSSMAVAISRYMHHNTDKSNSTNICDSKPLLADALYLRAKCLLSASRPKLATKVSNKLLIISLHIFY